jgi:hypothetical protein
VRPCTRCELASALAVSAGRRRVSGSLPACLTCEMALRPDIGQYQRTILDCCHRLVRGGLDERGRRRVSELRIDQTQDRMLTHDDFVDCERDQRTAGHGIVGHKDRALVFTDRFRDLQRRQYKTTSIGTSTSVIWTARRTSSESLMSM